MNGLTNMVGAPASRINVLYRTSPDALGLLKDLSQYLDSVITAHLKYYFTRKINNILLFSPVSSGKKKAKYFGLMIPAFIIPADFDSLPVCILAFILSGRFDP